jgi:endonuclease/exonuclease/phosphatase family metal-dependent hydrolase
MKLVTWNCAMGLAKKRQKLLTLGADVMVIQECSKPDIEQFSHSEGWSSWWVCENQKKGLGVLVRAPWVIREAHTLKPRWAGKLVIDGPASIELFPVWACKSKSPAVEYIEQVHLLLDIVEKTSLSPFTIVVGDFNSNSRWDSDYRIQNHSAAVERFRQLGMESAYHVFFGIPQGAEQLHPTLWFRKNKGNPYHIDYAFLSGPLLSKLKKVDVGRRNVWLPLSDHAPVSVELDL